MNSIAPQLRLSSKPTTYRWHSRLPSRRQPTSTRATGDDFFTGNYAPVKRELCTSDVIIQGTIPAELHGGMYLRNGPNPPFKPKGGYHWYEGDGMIHACWFKGPSDVVYSNQYITTLRLQEERRQQGKVFLRMCDMRGLSGFLKVASTFISSAIGLLDTSKGHPANTAVMHHAGKLLALFESDMPYQLQLTAEGRVATVGHTPLQEDVQHAVTAHPKVDLHTGILHYYSYSIQSQPYLTYGQVGPDGRVIKTVALDIPHPTLLHDFAITDRHAVFVVGPLSFDLKQMLLHEDLPFVWRGEQPARVGLLHMDAASGEEMQWFELPSFYLAHSVNAWHDPSTGRVHLLGNCIETSMVDLDWARRDGTFPPDLCPLLCEVVLDPATGQATRRRMSDIVADLPSIHPGLVGRPTRYAYIASLDTSKGMPTFNGIVKHDLATPAGQDSAVALLLHGDQCYSGEPLFVPRHDDPALCASEDDGFLLCFVHDEASGVSELRVYDALSMSAQPLVRIRTPQRVPYGFHGCFLRGQQVQELMEQTGVAGVERLRVTAVV